MVYIIDTNVLIVANDYNHQCGLRCVQNCINFLEAARNHVIAVDNLDLIFKEYRNNISLSGRPNVGDAFLKWLWDNRMNEDVCLQVPVKIRDHDKVKFEAIPLDRGFENFDLSDQKFIAVALALNNNASIVNATDSDWREHRQELIDLGIEVIELCPDIWN